MILLSVYLYERHLNNLQLFSSLYKGQFLRNKHGYFKRNWGFVYGMRKLSTINIVF